MGVAIALAGVDARRLEGDVNRGIFGLLCVVLDGSIERREAAADFGQKMTDLKGHLRMRFIDAVRRSLCNCSGHELLLCVNRTVMPDESVISRSSPSGRTGYPAVSAFCDA